MTETFVTDHMIILIQTLQSAPHMSAPTLQRPVDQTAASFSITQEKGGRSFNHAQCMRQLQNLPMPFAHSSDHEVTRTSHTPQGAEDNHHFLFCWALLSLLIFFFSHVP